MEGKPVRESASEYSELALPNDSNGFGNVLGGKVMHLVDLAAAGVVRGAGAGAYLVRTGTVVGLVSVISSTWILP